MLKKLKTPFPFGKTFCQFGKRWYFCTRFPETERDLVERPVTRKNREIT